MGLVWLIGGYVAIGWALLAMGVDRNGLTMLLGPAAIIGIILTFILPAVNDWIDPKTPADPLAKGREQSPGQPHQYPDSRGPEPGSTDAGGDGP